MTGVRSKLTPVFYCVENERPFSHKGEKGKKPLKPVRLVDEGGAEDRAGQAVLADRLQ